ncbi:MAG: outer membrane beta-barrel protein [Hyphomicrobiaceae bacterium]
MAPVDGVIDAPQPEQPVDGVDPSVVDTRTQEELGPFEVPPGEPTPDDPFATPIEIEPILDRRPARLARFEPFDPVGIRRGGFIIFPEAELSVAALDNLFRSSSNTRRDVALDVRPQVRMVSNWRQHAVEFRASGLSTFHNQFPSEDNRGGSLEARGRIDISRRTNIEAITGYERSQEARGSINAASRLGDRADVDTRKAGLTFNHRFNRLSIQLRGTVTDVDYSGTTSETGVFATNSERDVRTTEVAMRTQWDFKPTFGVFGETAFNWRDYGGVPSDGVTRESQGERVRVGVTFGNTSNRLRGEVSVGHGHQQFQDSRLPEIRGIIVDANLAWRVSGLTSILLTARTDVGESTQAGSGGALSRTAGLEVRHAFQRRLIGTAGLKQTVQDYEGVELTERELTALLGLEYYVNREVTLFSRYQHIAFDSTLAGRDYQTDEVRVGVRVRR